MPKLFFTSDKEKETQLKLAFWKIKEELGVHLETINASTQEIEEIFEAITRFESKIDKIEERIEKLELERQHPMRTMIMLPPREEEVYGLLFVRDDRMSHRQIANALSLSEEVVSGAVSNLIAKGIPVLRQVTSENVLIYLDKEFRESQKIHSSVHVQDRILSMLQNEK